MRRKTTEREEKEQQSSISTSEFHQELVHFLQSSIFPTTRPFSQMLAHHFMQSGMQGVLGNEVTKEKIWCFSSPITTNVFSMNVFLLSG